MPLRKKVARMTNKAKKAVIGVDFDNTIVCYDTVFFRVALEQNLIPPDLPSNKAAVRDYLRQCGKEDLWTELQGYVYGACMHHAPPFAGVIEFFDQCRRKGVIVYIISHKTRYPFLGPRFDLHQAARNWLESHGFFDSSVLGMQHDHVFFELTKSEKLRRIAEVGCTHFIDDLPEFLMEEAFPPKVVRILFGPNQNHGEIEIIQPASSWTEIARILSL
jgi:hypothetical protein